MAANVTPDLFPELTPDEIRERVLGWWHLAAPLPYPRRPLRCGACGGDELHAREWRIGPRNTHAGHRHRLGWRCDIGLKCCACSAVSWFGLAITEADARRYGARAARVRVVDWRTARGELAPWLAARTGDRRRAD